MNTLAVSVFLSPLCLIPQRRPKRAAGGTFSAPYPLLSLKTPILSPSVCVWRYVYMQVHVCLFGSARLLSVLPLIRLNMPGSRSTRAEARVYFQVSGKAANVGPTLPLDSAGRERMQLLALKLLRELRRGYPTALLAERGIPLLQMQQTLQLTQLYYRLRVSAPSTAIT